MRLREDAGTAHLQQVCSNSVNHDAEERTVERTSTHYSKIIYKNIVQQKLFFSRLRTGIK